jgi:hypothetical protein
VRGYRFVSACCLFLLTLGSACVAMGQPPSPVLGAMDAELERSMQNRRGVEGAEYSNDEQVVIREQLGRRFHGRRGAGRGGRINGSGDIGRALASIRRCHAAQDTR